MPVHSRSSPAQTSLAAEAPVLKLVPPPQSLSLAAPVCPSWETSCLVLATKLLGSFQSIFQIESNVHRKGDYRSPACWASVTHGSAECWVIAGPVMLSYSSLHKHTPVLHPALVSRLLLCMYAVHRLDGPQPLSLTKPGSNSSSVTKEILMSTIPSGPIFLSQSKGPSPLWSSHLTTLP